MKEWEELTDEELDIFMEKHDCKFLTQAYNEYQIQLFIEKRKGML